jgi:hypothetical protein
MSTRASFPKRLFSILSFLVGLTILQVQAKMTTDIHIKTTMNPQEKNHGFAFLDDVREKYSHQPTFLQSVEEMAFSLEPLFKDPEQGDFYKRAFVAMTEPERTISFRIPWEDDNGEMHFNRGWRVEFSR